MLTFVSASVCLMSGLSISRGVFPVCLTCLRQSQWPALFCTISCWRFCSHVISSILVYAKMISNCIVKREDVVVRFCASVSADPRVGCGWFGSFRPPVAFRMVDEECHEFLG